MKKTLYRRFLLLYLVVGIAGFFLVFVFGSYLTERHLEESYSQDFYREATTLAENSTLRYQASQENLDAIYRTLSALAASQELQIFLMNSDGDVLLDTDSDQVSPDALVSIPAFDPTDWGNSYYQIGDFYGYFSQETLSVIAPITADMDICGYLAFHYPMMKLYQKRSNYILITEMIFILFYGISFLFLAFFTVHVYRPIEKIANGAKEFAHGNLTYRIPVNSADELGYLARSLNYMADSLNQNSEFQRNFISNVSHDFRSPLTSIKGYVEAIEDGTIPVEMQGKYLNIICNEISRLEKLTRSLLTLNNLDIKSRLLNLQNFDINATIKNTAATFEGTCTKRQIQLSLILHGNELLAYADQEQIQQVLYNLIDNAVKFSPDNSVITIETTEKGGKIFVSVKDHGSGIPKESLNKIWDRFYKLDTSRGRDRKGTGLGLSIVKEVIKAHNQNINVVSTEGVGTEFIFTLEKRK